MKRKPFQHGLAARHSVVKRSLFYRIQLFSALLIALVLLSAGIWFNRQTVQEYGKTFAASCMTAAHEHSIAIELVLDGVLEIANDIHYDATIQRFLEPDGRMTTSEKSAVLEKARQLHLSHRYVESAYIYSAQSGLVASSAYGVADVGAFPDAESIFRAMNERRAGRIFVLDTHPASRSLSDRSLDYDALSLVAQLPFAASSEIQGLVLLNIDQKRLYDDLYARKLSADGIDLFIVGADDQIMLSQDGESLYATLDDIGIDAAKLSGDSGTLALYFHGMAYLLAYEAIPGYDWKVIGLFPTEGLERSVRHSVRLYLLVSLAVLALALLASFAYFNHYTKPVDGVIHYIRTHGEGVEGITPALQQEIERIYSSNSELQARIEELRPLFGYHFLLSVLNGTQYEPEELRERFAAYYGADIDCAALHVCIFLLENFDRDVGAKKLDPYLVDAALLEEIAAASRQSGLKCVCMHTDISENVLIVDLNGHKLSEVNLFLARLKDYAERTWGLKSASSVCDSPVALTDLRTGYRRAKEALRYRSFYDGETIYYSDVVGDERVRFYYPFDLADELKSCIRLCDQAGAHAALKAILDAVIEGSGPNQNAYLALFQIYGTLMSVSDELNIPLGEVFKNKYVVQAIFEMHSRGDIAFFFEACVDKLIAILSKQRTDRVSDYYQRIMDCLRENYRSSDMSLDALSERVQLSPSYVNRILKSAGGKTFNQLLIDLRLQEACRLISSGDMKVNQVAQCVGFGSSKYFISVFKKALGVTPGQYKAMGNKLP